MSALASTALWPLPAGDALRSDTAAPDCTRPAGALVYGTKRQTSAAFGGSAVFQPAVSPVSNRRQAAPSPSILATGVIGRLVTALGMALGLAGGLVIAYSTGDFILPPLLGASFGGAASTAIDI